jgi:hypothetical protein
VSTIHNGINWTIGRREKDQKKKKGKKKTLGTYCDIFAQIMALFTPLRTLYF